MIEQLIVVEEGHNLSARFTSARPVSAGSAKELREAMSRSAQGAICIARPAPMVRWLADLDPLPKTSHRLLIIGRTHAPERAFLSAVFENVVVPDDDTQLLKLDDLFEVMSSPHRANLFIGGTVARTAKSVVLIRGNLNSLVVPFSWFTPRPTGPMPNFSDFEIIDSGQTIRLGRYEAAADAILYELDPEFRRRERKRRISEDKSLGGALRRLRLQRGLRRDEFTGVTAKTIARIERGEVKEPHPGTLAAIAETLGVKPKEIATF